MLHGAVDQLAMAERPAEQVEALAALHLHRQPHVLERAEVGKEIGELEGAAEAEMRPPRRRGGRAASTCCSVVTGIPSARPGMAHALVPPMQ